MTVVETSHPQYRCKNYRRARFDQVHCPKIKRIENSPPSTERNVGYQKHVRDRLRTRLQEAKSAFCVNRGCTWYRDGERPCLANHASYWYGSGTSRTRWRRNNWDGTLDTLVNTQRSRSGTDRDGFGVLSCKECRRLGISGL
jgi:hypothetical protein